MANNSEDFTVNVLFGDGKGNFSAPTKFSTGGQYPDSVAVADFNHDGKLDLAVANGGSLNVGILLGDGHGGFSAPTTFASGGYYPYSVAVGDFNGDGNADLVTANCGGKSIGVLLGNGNGGFSGPVTYAAAGNYPWDVVVGDFNGDGKADVAAADEINIGTNGFADVLLGEWRRDLCSGADLWFRGPRSSYDRQRGLRRGWTARPGSVKPEQQHGGRASQCPGFRRLN